MPKSRGTRRLSVSKKPPKSKSNTKAVVGLINALHSQRKFKRLCIYSLEAMVKQVCPPNTTWQDSVEDLVGSRGIKVLKDLLTRYGDDEQILTAVTKILSQMPKHSFLGKTFAKQLIQEGAILDTLKAMEKNPNLKDKALENGLEVVEKCAAVNAKAMGTKDVCTAIENVQKHHAKDKSVHNACARTFERIVKSRAAAKVFVDCDKIEYTFEAMQMPASNAVSVLSQIRTLNRLAVKKENIERIEKCDGLKKCVGILEAYPEIPELQRAGGRLINTVAGEYVDKIMADLMKKDADPAQREYYAQLLASLALKSKSAKKILQCHGVKQVMELLKDPTISPKMTSSLMLILQRLSNINTAVVAKDIKGGGLDTILHMAKMYKDDPLVCATCISSLSALAMDAGTLKKLEELGGIETVIETLLKHPDFKDAAIHGTAFVGQLVALDYPVDKLIQMGGVKACLLAIKTNPDNADVVLNTMIALAAIAGSGKNAALEIGRSGIVAAVESLRSFPDDEHIVLNALGLLNSLAGYEKNRKEILDLGGVDAVVQALYTHSENGDVRKLGEAILNAVVTDASVKSALAVLEKYTPQIANGADATLDKVRVALMNLTIFASSKAGTIADANGASTILKTFEELKKNAKKKKNKVSTACVRGCFRALSELCHQSEGIEATLTDQFKNSKGVSSIIDYVTQNAKDSDTAIDAVRLLHGLLGFYDADTLVDKGIVEAVVGPLRMAQSLDLSKACIDTIAKISISGKGAKALIDRGATRQLIKSLSHFSDQAGYDDCCLQILNTLDRVARMSSGVAALQKQKAVHAVIKCITAHYGNDDIEKAGLRVLGALMDKEKVRSEVEKLVDRSKKISEKNLKSLSTSLTTVALCSLVGNYTDTVIAAGGPEAFTRSLKALEAMAPSKERNTAIRQAILGLSLVSKKVSPKLYQDAIGIVISCLEDYPTSCLTSLEAFAAHSENIDTILSSGALKSMITLLENNGDDTNVVEGIFKTFAELAKHKKARDAMGALDAVEQVVNWLKENADDADPIAMASCVQYLANMSTDPAYAKAISASGAVDLVLDLVSDGLAGPETVAAGLNLFEHVCVALPEQCAAQVASGMTDRLMRLFSASGGKQKGRRGSQVALYGQSKEAAMAMVAYIANLAKDPKLDAQLKAIHAADTLMYLMKLHSNNPALMKVGKDLLSKMLSPKELLQRSLADARRVEKSLSAGEVSARNLDRLQSAYNDVLNSLRMGKGKVTKADGQDVLRTLQTTVKIVKEIESGHPTLASKTKEIMYTGFEVIGALDELNLGLKLIQVVPSLIAELANCERDKDAPRALQIVKTLHEMANEPEVLDLVVEDGVMKRLLSLRDMAVTLNAQPLLLALKLLMKDVSDHVLGKSDALIRKGRAGQVLEAIDVLGATIDGGIDGVIDDISKRAGGCKLLALLLNVKADANAADADEQQKKLDQLKVYIANWTRDAIANGGAQAIDPVLLQSVLTVLGDLQGRNVKQLGDFEIQLYGKHMDVLTQLASTPEGTKMLLGDPKMLKMVIKLMGIENKGMAVKASALLVQMAAHAKDPKILDLLLNEKIVAMAIATQGSDTMLKSPEFAANTLQLINHLVTCGGTDALTKAGFTRDHMNVLNEWGRKFKKNETIAAHLASGATSSMMQVLKKKFPNSIEDQLADFFGSMEKDIDDVYALRTAEDKDSGKIYYINKDNSTTWKRPPELDEFITTLKRGATNIKKYNGNADSHSTQLIQKSVQVLNNLVRDIDLVKNIVQALNHMADDDSNLKKMAENGGIEAIIRVLKIHPDDDDLLRTLLLLIEKFCHNTVFKERIGKVGAVEVLVLAAERQAYGDGPLPFGWRRCYDHNKKRHYYYNKDAKKSSWKRPETPDEFKSQWKLATDKEGRPYFFNRTTKKTEWTLPAEELARRRAINGKLDKTPHNMLVAQVLNVLVKLTFRSKQNTKLANEDFRGADSVRKVLECFQRSPRIGEVAFTLITNWAVNAQYRLKLREAAGDLILSFIHNLHYDAAMFKSALRALGNMSLVYENVRYLVKQGAVEEIVKRIDSPNVSDEVKETAVRVICIFAQAQARRKSKDPVKGLTICQMIYNAKGAHAIIKIAKAYIESSPSMMKASVEALNAIASDARTASLLLPANLLELVVQIMKAMDYDVAVLEPCFELVFTLVRNDVRNNPPEKAMDRLVKIGGIPVVLTVLGDNDHSKYILTYGIRMINVLSIAMNEKHRDVVLNTNTVDTLVHLLESHSDEPKPCLEILRALSNLAAPPEEEENLDLSELIADKAIHAVVHVINLNATDADVVNGALQLIGFLSFKAENVQMIVRMGGIGMIMNALSNHVDNETIVTRCVKNLDFIAISHKDNALIVIEHEGVRLIKAIKEEYKANSEVIAICDSALLSFGTVDDGGAASPSPSVPSPGASTEASKEVLPDVDWDEFD